MVAIQKSRVVEVVLVVIVDPITNYPCSKRYVQCCDVFGMLDLCIILMKVGDDMSSPIFEIGITIITVLLLVTDLK